MQPAVQVLAGAGPTWVVLLQLPFSHTSPPITPRPRSCRGRLPLCAGRKLPGGLRRWCQRGLLRGGGRPVPAVLQRPLCHLPLPAQLLAGEAAGAVPLAAAAGWRRAGHVCLCNLCARMMPAISASLSLVPHHPLPGIPHTNTSMNCLSLPAALQESVDYMGAEHSQDLPAVLEQCIADYGKVLVFRGGALTWCPAAADV